MNDDIRRWVIEFLLRSPMDDHLLKRVLAVIPIPDKDFRLKKTVLLKTIVSEISEAVVTEKLLEIFEMIEGLDETEGLAIMESMKAAYCAVAVECTVKYLAVGGGIDKRGKYVGAVKRIWRGRVTELERLGKSKLVSDEMKVWKGEIEASFSDNNVLKKLVIMNSRYEALKLTLGYLGEAWTALGPSFLQLSASLMGKPAIVREDVAVSGNGGIELPSRTENVARLERRGSGQVILSQAETKATEEESIEKEAVVLHTPSPRCGSLRTTGLPKCKSLALHKRVRGGINITDQLPSQKSMASPSSPNPSTVEPKRISSHLEDLEKDNSSEKYTCLDTPEVNRVREALKISSSELQVLVKDPLPNALRIAESVAHDLAEKNKTHEHSLEDQNDARSVNPTINKDAMPLQSVKTDLKNPFHGHQTIASRPSIMERNSTASTSEWNDSLDPSLEEKQTSRLHLPSPKRKVISPLKKYVETKFTRRRTIRKWSLLEEDALRTAVQKFGKGNWKLILNSHRDIFDERTDVDLKDKWRNMTRY